MPDIADFFKFSLPKRTAEQSAVVAASTIAQVNDAHHHDEGIALLVF
jgi:hypothetical protein